MDYSEIQKKWKDDPIITEADLERKLDNFRILFAYHSGKIENAEITYHDTREIFENGKIINFTGDPRTVFEIQNQKVCWDFLKDKIFTREPLSVELIKKIHEKMTTGTYDERRFEDNSERPGEFKRHDYVTGILEVGAAPEEVPELIADLVEEVNDFSSDNHLLAAAYLHANFENIHPFADGNGRVGRTIMNYYLMINNEPPVIVYDDDKKLYYKALEAYDISEDLAPLQTFLEMETVRTWTREPKQEKKTSLKEQLQQISEQQKQKKDS